MSWIVNFCICFKVRIAKIIPHFQEKPCKKFILNFCFLDKKSFKEKRKEYRNQWKSENNSDTTNTEEQYPAYKPKKYGK